MFSLLRRSLAFKATLLIVAAAACGVMLTMSLAHHLVTDRLHKEALAIERFAEARMAERFGTEVALTQQRLRMLASALEDGLAIMAGEGSLRVGLILADRARIAEALAPDLKRLGFSTGILFDKRLKAIGGHQPGIDLAAVNEAFSAHDLSEGLSDLLDVTDGARPFTYWRIIRVDALLSRVVGSPPGAVVLLVASPVLGARGEIEGLVLASRPLARVEPVLNDLARTIGAGISLHSDGRLVSLSEEALPQVELQEAGRLIHANDGKHVGLCNRAFGFLTICLTRPRAEIVSYRDEVTAIGVRQSSRTSLLLLAFGTIGLVIMALVGLWVATLFTRPLVDITEGVDRVASGEWRASIVHAEREDEIGQIARAVAAMQARLEERDRMRTEIARIEAITQRRHAMANAVKRFEDGVGSVMRNLTGTLKSLAKTQGALGKAARDAAVQVEWISTSSADTISRANAISGATLHLSEGIREIGQRAANASHSAETGASSLEKAGAGLETACAVSLRCEQELAAMLTVVADLNTAILGVSGEAAATSGNTLAFVRAAGSANDMAQQAVAEIEVLRDLVSTTARTIDESRDMFGHVGQQAGEIVVAVAEQGAATREIATSLAAAADALQGLTQSVEALKTSFAGANGATDEFITIAYRMVEDARSIDNGVRSFLQDAVA